MGSDSIDQHKSEWISGVTRPLLLCRRTRLANYFNPIGLPLYSIIDLVNRINVITRNTVPFSLISGGHAKLLQSYKQFGERMFNKTLTLVLFGVLFMGTATLTYGTFFDKGFVASAIGMMGLGNDEHGEDDDDD